MGGRWIVDTGSQDRHRCYAVAIDAGDQMRLDAAAGEGLTFEQAERYITRMRRHDAAARAAAVAERGRANLARWRAHVAASKGEVCGNADALPHEVHGGPCPEEYRS